MVFAFAFNPKSFAIAILFFFIFFVLVTFSGRTAKKVFTERFINYLEKVCDQDLAHSLDTLKCLPVNIVLQVVIRDACGT